MDFIKVEYINEFEGGELHTVYLKGGRYITTVPKLEDRVAVVSSVILIKDLIFNPTEGGILWKNNRASLFNYSYLSLSICSSDGEFELSKVSISKYTTTNYLLELTYAGENIGILDISVEGMFKRASVSYCPTLYPHLKNYPQLFDSLDRFAIVYEDNPEFIRVLGPSELHIPEAVDISGYVKFYVAGGNTFNFLRHKTKTSADLKEGIISLGLVDRYCSTLYTILTLIGTVTTNNREVDKDILIFCGNLVSDDVYEDNVEKMRQFLDKHYNNIYDLKNIIVI